MTRSDLHEYQETAVKFILEHPSAGLLLDMGLGKTAITLTAVNELLYGRFESERALVIAPLRVAQSTWAQEALQWEHLEHLTFAKALGSRKEREAALQAGADITIINRENVRWLVEFYGKKWPFDLVVIDELSSFRSNCQRFKALRSIRPRIKRIVGLTGTPAPKSLLDLWPQMYLLDQGKALGHTLTAYRNAFFTPGRRNAYTIYEWLPRPGAAQTIYGLLQGLCISMKAADWLELPPGVPIVRKVELPPGAQAAYKALEKDLVLSLEDSTVSAASRGVLAGKLQQYANGAVYLDEQEGEEKAWREIHQAKLDELAELIESANGQPVLVYYGYRHDAERIQARFPEARLLKTDADVEDWNAKRIPVLLAHPASAGHGLNLQQGGSVIVWFGLTWNLELYQQANARLLRQGQKEAVRIYHIVTEGTRDADCLPVLEGRAVRQEDLLNALKARVQKGEIKP